LTVHVSVCRQDCPKARAQVLEAVRSQSRTLVSAAELGGNLINGRVGFRHAVDNYHGNLAAQDHGGLLQKRQLLAAGNGDGVMVGPGIRDAHCTQQFGHRIGSLGRRQRTVQRREDQHGIGGRAGRRLHRNKPVAVLQREQGAVAKS
jgi:hypothetical protein